MATIQGTNEGEPEKILDEAVHEDDAGEEIVVVSNPEAAVDYARDLAFMNEKVEVMILETQDQNDSTRLVTVAVNGKQYHFLRGQWRTCPRFVLEMLAKAKRERWGFSYKKNPDGSTSDINQMNKILRFPHHYRDKNPAGSKWYDSIKDKSY